MYVCVCVCLSVGLCLFGGCRNIYICMWEDVWLLQQSTNICVKVITKFQILYYIYGNIVLLQYSCS